MRVHDGGDEAVALGPLQEADEPARGPCDVDRRGGDAILLGDGEDRARDKPPTGGARPGIRGDVGGGEQDVCGRLGPVLGREQRTKLGLVCSEHDEIQHVRRPRRGRARRA